MGHNCESSCYMAEFIPSIICPVCLQSSQAVSTVNTKCPARLICAMMKNIMLQADLLLCALKFCCISGNYLTVMCSTIVYISHMQSKYEYEIFPHTCTSQMLPSLASL